MNIDLEALRTIESERNVPVKDLLEAIAGALLYSYLDSVSYTHLRAHET